MMKMVCAVLLLLMAACSKSPDNQTTVNNNTTTTAQQQQQTQAQANAGQQPANANAQPSPATSAQSSAQFDACTLLTKAEVAEVQGDEVSDTKSSTSSQGDFLLAQCFYTTGNFANSVSLSLALPDPANSSSRGPRKFWEKTFHEQNENEGEHERGRGEGGEEEERVPPQRVKGLGEEAYWSANRVGGVLYVLKKNSFLRVSVGGSGDNDARLRRCKAMAQKALKRMA